MTNSIENTLKEMYADVRKLGKMMKAIDEAACIAHRSSINEGSCRYIMKHAEYDGCSDKTMMERIYNNYDEACIIAEKEYNNFCDVKQQMQYLLKEIENMTEKLDSYAKGH